MTTATVKRKEAPSRRGVPSFGHRPIDLRANRGERDEIAAFHEAGHLLTAVLLGFRGAWSDMDPSEPGDQACTYFTPAPNWKAQARAQKELCVTCAGVQAEVLRYGQPLLGYQSDAESVRQLAKSFAPERRTDVIERAHSRARELLTEHLADVEWIARTLGVNRAISLSSFVHDGETVIQIGLLRWQPMPCERRVAA